MKRRFVAVMLFLAIAAPAGAQRQVEDSTFVPRVAKPAFSGRGPVVMIDEAHHNHFTMDGRYRAFAALLREDGLRVVPGMQPFSPALLETCRVLIVADAISTERLDDRAARASAFRISECDAVRDWVKGGGSLLLIADPAPFASAMDSLGRRLGVDMGKGRTLDTRRVDPETGNFGCILFTRSLRRLGEHAITRGRNASERIDRVASFTGQSLKGPRGSAELLLLGSSSWDLPFSPDARRVADPEALRMADRDSVVAMPGAVTAFGRSQGVAFTFGKGRVVVLGDGAMFGSQFVLGLDARRQGMERLRVGLNRPDLDNPQFALNTLHWLTRVLN